MHANHPAPLLVAALVMLRHPCARNTATAQLLLERAAEHPGLSPAEREACRSVADDLCSERREPGALRAHWLPPSPVSPQGAGRGCPRKGEAVVVPARGRPWLSPQGGGRGCKADKSATTTL